jgi:antitoxin PrlF
MIQATIESKGQVTIPKMILDFLHLNSGDKINFAVTDRREAILRPASKSKSVDEVFGLLASKKRGTFTIEEMNDNLRRAFREKKI